MRSLADFADEMDDLAAKYPQTITSSLSVECAEIILTDLLNVTPVDTSKALSNWQVTLDEPATTPIPAYYPGDFAATAVVSRTAALEAARVVLAEKKPGQTIYITNCLPYIDGLNSGSSTQEPAGFVERAQLLGRLFSEDPASFQS